MPHPPPYVDWIRAHGAEPCGDLTCALYVFETWGIEEWGSSRFKYWRP